MPPDDLRSPQDLWKNPEAIAQRLPKISGKLLFLLNLSQTSVRLSDASFPFDGEANYNFSRKVIAEEIWTTAAPAHISDSLVEMCRIKKIRPGRIHSIDTLEYRMSQYFGRLFKDSGSGQCPFWLLLPQEPGVRLIALQGGVPCGSYFFSNDPDFRLKELTRLWMHKPAGSAFVMSDDPVYLWLRKFLQEKSVNLLEQDFRQAMISEWIKAI
jgi:hypothetical protein